MDTATQVDLIANALWLLVFFFSVFGVGFSAAKGRFFSLAFWLFIGQVAVEALN